MMIPSLQPGSFSQPASGCNFRRVRRVTEPSTEDFDFEPLVVAASRGDETSWHELWRRLEPRLGAVLRNPSVLGRLSAFEDAVKDVLVAVMAKLRDGGFRRLHVYLDARRANPDLLFVAWVTVMAKRAAIDRIRADPNYIDLRRNAERSGAWVDTFALPDESRMPGFRPPLT